MSLPADAPVGEGGSEERHILYDLVVPIEWPEITSILVKLTITVCPWCQFINNFGYSGCRKRIFLSVEKNFKEHQR